MRHHLVLAVATGTCLWVFEEIQWILVGGTPLSWHVRVGLLGAGIVWWFLFQALLRTRRLQCFRETVLDEVDPLRLNHKADIAVFQEQEEAVPFVGWAAVPSGAVTDVMSDHALSTGSLVQVFWGEKATNLVLGEVRSCGRIGCLLCGQLDMENAVFEVERDKRFLQPLKRLQREVSDVRPEERIVVCYALLVCSQAEK